MSYYPITAFNFACIDNASQLISQIKVEDLKRGYLEWVGNIPLNEIKGFENYAAEINNEDEFTIKEKLQFYIQKLNECWVYYYTEYSMRYLKGVNGTYIYLEDDYKGATVFSLSKNAYDFDNETLEINLVDVNYDWCVNQANKMNTYRTVQIHFPISKAKVFFGSADPCYYQSYDKVRLIPRGYQVFTGKATLSRVRYAVVQIKKYFYKKEQWSDEKGEFVGEPIDSMIFESSEDFPLSDYYYTVYVNSLKREIGFDEFSPVTIVEGDKSIFGTYTLFDKKSGMKKTDFVVSLSHSVHTSIIDYKGRGGSSKRSVPDAYISGNKLSLGYYDYEFVTYHGIRGLLGHDGNGFIFFEKTK